MLDAFLYSMQFAWLIIVKKTEPNAVVLLGLSKVNSVLEGEILRAVCLFNKSLGRITSYKHRWASGPGCRYTTERQGHLKNAPTLRERQASKLSSAIISNIQ